MNLRKLFYLMLILPLLFLYTGCSDDDGDVVDPTTGVNEAEVLVKHLESNGDFINTGAPAMIKASNVRTNLVAGADQVVLDIRAADAYNAGHIDGAINVAPGDVLDYYESNNLAGEEVVVIACYSGQTAAWVTGLMNILGYNNVKDLKWGMSSWNPETSGPWVNGIGNSRATELVTTSYPKAEEGELPELNTGAEEGADILRARVEEVFAEGFGAAKVSNADVFASPGNYYIVNYWKQDHYDWGHIPGAIQYTPKSSFRLDADLKTLPTDKTIAVYCYTGQTSAHVAAFLRSLGYDAKSIVYGVNAMAYDNMPGTRFVAETEVHDYDLAK